MTHSRLAARIKQLEAKRPKGVACRVNCTAPGPIPDFSLLTPEEAERYKALRDRPRIIEACPHCGRKHSVLDVKTWSDAELDDMIHLYERLFGPLSP